MRIINFVTLSVIALIVFFASCKKDTFEETPGLLCPEVIATSPIRNETKVPVAKVITVTFNKEMNPATMIWGVFTLRAANEIPGVVSYDSTSATLSFTPTNLLDPNTTFTGKVTTGAKDPRGSRLQQDYIWTFSTGDTLTPMVIVTDPKDNAFGVPFNKVVTAGFSMPMDPLTLDALTFIIEQGANPISGQVSYVDSTTSFVPTNALLPNTLYKATITTGAKTPSGIALANNYSWTFRTQDTLQPVVISTDPIDSARNVPFTKTVSATFNQIMDPLTIDANSFLLKQGANTVPGAVSYSGSTAFYNPTSNLSANTDYTATITTLAKNPDGLTLAKDYVWTFRTLDTLKPVVIDTDPKDLATNVPFNKTVTATFNQVMDPLTIDASSFLLKEGANTVPGAVSYLGITASYNPTGNLSPNTLYTATITTLAKSPTGVAMANDYVWTFRTLDTLTPIVILTSPLDKAIGVAFNKTVTATFNQVMDPLTIDASSFLLKNGAVTVPGSVSYSGSTASYNPSSNLAPKTLYTATITTLAKNPSGIAMASDHVWTFTTLDTNSGPFIDLKSALNFGILAGVGVSNNAGFSEIHDMNVGISPGVRSSVTGFPPAIVVNGAIFASDDASPAGVAAMLTQAKTDLTNAYLAAEGATSPAPTTVSGDQGGLTLAPGIYKSTSTLKIQSGNLTLDAKGDPNAFWVFQIASGFTTVGGAGGSVILTGGAKASNIFWQVGSSATIGDGTIFKGNILALTSITMNSGAVAEGRMLARNGSVVMTNTNTITKP